MNFSVTPEVELLRQSPLLPDILEDFERHLQQEKPRRAKFYAEMTPEQKTEFIAGDVIVHSPARNAHLTATRNLFFALWSHIRGRSMGQAYVERCLCTFPRNDYEPDVVFFGPEKAATFSGEMMRFPVPDFVAEVLSESTEANDRGVKFVDYGAHGVAEYWIIDADQRVLEQYAAKDGRFELVAKMNNGRVESIAIPGFTLDVTTLFTE